jgi:hypothetical protein
VEDLPKTLSLSFAGRLRRLTTMAIVQCNCVHRLCNPCRTRKPPLSPVSHTHFISTVSIPSCASSKTLKLSTPRSLSLSSLICSCSFKLYSESCRAVTLNCRLSRAVSAVVSEENAVGSSSSGTGVFKLTYLEVGLAFLIWVFHKFASFRGSVNIYM